VDIARRGDLQRVPREEFKPTGYTEASGQEAKSSATVVATVLMLLDMFVLVQRTV